MRTKEPEDRVDPNKPALIVLYGATKRKCRPLPAELTVIGRGPGCDIGLVSPEVAPVHCVIFRLSGGWRIRDCSGRATRVNGRAVEEEPLNNGDVIQIGTFSFEAHLPGAPDAGSAAAEPAEADPEVIARLQASRRRVIEKALSLRQQLQQANAQADDLARREQDLAQLERRLRAASQARASEKADVAPPVSQPAQPRAEQADAEAEALARRLDHRRTELNHYARHLRRLEQKLREKERRLLRQTDTEHADYETDLASARLELEKERRLAADLRQQVEQRHVELEQTASLLEEELLREKEQIENERNEMASERAELDQQRLEVTRMRVELERRAEQQRVAAQSTRETLYDEQPTDRLAAARKLLHQLAERRKSLSQTPGPD